MQIRFIWTLLSLFVLGCSFAPPSERHVFYLHARIIELQGIQAVSERFGPYQYLEIINALRQFGAVVHHEVRPENINFNTFCQKIARQIDSLIENGVETENITVIGASKGGLMAMQISSINSNPINYVLLGANNDGIELENNWNLHGNILGIYEQSDSIAGKNYQYWINQSTNAERFDQVQINTGLGHGFLYQPLKEWLEPSRKWMER